MWSEVNEKITDGTSGLLPSSGLSALVVGTSTKGSLANLGKDSDVEAVFGYGELSSKLQDMQSVMDDVLVLGARVEGQGFISEITVNGENEIVVSGNPQCKTHIRAEICTEGFAGEAELSLTISGDFAEERIVSIPQDGIVELEHLAMIFDVDCEYLAGQSWEFGTERPKADFDSVEKVLSQLLEVYTPEFIFVAQSVDADFVKKLGVLSESLFDSHKPVMFLTETSLDEDLSYAEAVTAKQEEFAKVDARFVGVVCQPISVSGFCAGHITRASVNQSIGATNNFALYDMDMPSAWTNADSRALDNSGFITLRTYAGLQNHFWSNGRTMGSLDYRFVEVVRTVFKAVRLARSASLPYIHAPGDTVGLQNLISAVRNNLETMVASGELDQYSVDMPSGQDIVNNGVLLNISLFGIPVIREITLNFSMRYNESE